MKKIILIIFMFILLVGCNKSNDNSKKEELKKEIDLDILVQYHNEIFNNLSDDDSYVNDNKYVCKKYMGGEKPSVLIENVFNNNLADYVERKYNNNYSVYFCVPDNCNIKIIKDYSSYKIDDKSYINVDDSEYILSDNKLKAPIFDCDRK